MPKVPYPGKEYIVNASIPGLYAQHLIRVKNKTRPLKIHLSADYAEEMERFNVTIKHRDEPVIGANLWFNSGVYISDYQGNVTLTAPDVLVTTNYGLFVNKTGYRSNATTITVKEANKGLKLMEIINPYIVEPGKENIEIKVIGKHGGLENVTLEIYYENTKHSEYKTNGDGKTYIKTPMVNNDNYFMLCVYKEGYRTYTGDKCIRISLSTRDLTSNLKIKLTQSEVYEGEGIIVEVTDDLNKGVKGATIWRGNMELDETTDSQGILEFSAPAVFLDRECFIYAIKEGYNFAENKITVRDMKLKQEKLTIETKNTINESETFYITTKDEQGIPIKEVTVRFNQEWKFTDENGKVSFLAPKVDNTTFYTIEANKYGYQPATTSIEVKDLGITDNVSSKIMICVAPYIMENEIFTVIVRNEQGDPIPHARVKFMDTLLYTDYQGMVTFTSPDVNWDTIHEILVTKSGYESESTEITIKNHEGFQYWYLIIAIVVIFIIGIAAYYKYGQII
jgi:hypothetical protein